LSFELSIELNFFIILRKVVITTYLKLCAEAEFLLVFGLVVEFTTVAVPLLPLRLRRETDERIKANRLLAGGNNAAKSQMEKVEFDDRKRKYNNQFNPSYAKY
jgi:hypothetical protein